MPETQATVEPVEDPKLGFVYTFYSFKGGVGRSMALANVGVTLAMEGKKVLLVDWDLEAPGLEAYFANPMRIVKGGSHTPGVIDLLESHADGQPLDWRECCQRATFLESSLDIISAGRRTEDYLKRVQHLNWETLYSEHDIGNYIDSLRSEWRETYDFILVDSRTGVTDIGDICTVLLPDVLVLMFVTNQQNLDGITNVLARASRAHAKLPLDRAKLLAVPVLSRDERDREYQLSLQWQAKAAAAFNDAYRDWLPPDVTAEDALNRLFIPYVASWSFGEKLPALENERERSDPTSIGAAYTRLGTLLENKLDWSVLVERKGTESDFAATRQQLHAAREDLRKAEEEKLAAAARAAEEARELNERLTQEIEQRNEEKRLEAQLAEIALRRQRSYLIAAIVIFGVMALSVLWLTTSHRPVASSLSSRLVDKEAMTRIGALDEVAQLGPGARNQEAGVLRLLRDPNAQVRRSAVRAMVSIGTSAADHPKDFEALLQDRDPEVLREALRAVAWQGTGGARYVPQVIALMQSSDADVRAEAVLALSRMGEISSVHDELVVRLLSDPDNRVRLGAVRATSRLQRNGADHFSAVAALRSDVNEDVRAAAAECLGQMGQAVGLASFLDDAVPSIRARAALSLAKLGEPAFRFAPKIASLLRDPEMSVRLRAIDALILMGLEGAKFADDIAGRLSDSEWQVRLKAVSALGTLGALAPRYASAVGNAQFDENGVVRDEAQRVLPFLKRQQAAPEKR